MLDNMKAHARAQVIRLAIGLAAAAAIVAAPVSQAGRADDLLVLQDGGVRKGRLDRCSESACTLDGIPVPRRSIRFIGLNGVQPPPPQAGDPAHDEIRLADSSVRRSRLAAIDAANVISADATYPRRRVAWIYLAPKGETAPPPAARGAAEAPEPPPGHGGSTGRKAPPWFKSDTQCELEKTNSLSWGVSLAYDNSGKIIGSLPDGKVTCALSYTICGDSFFKQQVIDTGKATCPESLHFSRAPEIDVCCAAWREAKRTKRPCDPLVDSDCDGVPNHSDNYPLDVTRR